MTHREAACDCPSCQSLNTPDKMRAALNAQLRQGSLECSPDEFVAAAMGSVQPLLEGKKECDPNEFVALLEGKKAAAKGVKQQDTALGRTAPTMPASPSNKAEPSKAEQKALAAADALAAGHFAEAGERAVFVDTFVAACPLQAGVLQRFHQHPHVGRLAGLLLKALEPQLDPDRSTAHYAEHSPVQAALWACRLVPADASDEQSTRIVAQLVDEGAVEATVKLLLWPPPAPEAETRSKEHKTALGEWRCGARFQTPVHVVLCLADKHWRRSWRACSIMRPLARRLCASCRRSSCVAATPAQPPRNKCTAWFTSAPRMRALV